MSPTGGDVGYVIHPTPDDPVWTQTSDTHFLTGSLGGTKIDGAGDAAALTLPVNTFSWRRPLAIDNTAGAADDLRRMLNRLIAGWGT